MLIGYACVSKADGSQVLDLQTVALKAAGVKKKDIYADRASGSRADRPGLEGCIRALRGGDTLVVWKLDRLGRSLRHLVNLVDELGQHSVGLKVLAGEGDRDRHDHGRRPDVLRDRGQPGRVRAWDDLWANP